MNPAATSRPATRAEQIDHVAGHLLANAALLARLLVKQLRSDISRTEAGVLHTVSEGPRRITELAALEGLAQPTMTLLVQRLERHGWVTRERHAGDGRVVLVSVTQAGRATLEEFRAQVADALHTYLEAMTDEQIAALETATDALTSLVDALQGGAPA